MPLALAAVLPAQPAFAQRAPAIAPTQLDFDASNAPKNCNDDVEFRNLLSNWAPKVMVDDAERRLVVRIRRLPTGAKLVDVTLVDAADAPHPEHHQRYKPTTECHRVLYETAYAAANLLGAFDKPPPPEPCPTCPPPAAPAKPEPCAAFPAPSIATPLVPRIELPPPFTRRGFIGAGVFFGTGITPVGAIGPHLTFGFLLSPRVPRMQFEIGGGWVPQTLPKLNNANALRVNMVPLVGSLCYGRDVFRLCSGLATTFYTAERSSLVPGNDELRTTLAVNMQIGTEFEIAGPFSIRLDVFGRLRFMHRTYGSELANLEALNVFTAGALAMGMWSFE